MSEEGQGWSCDQGLSRADDRCNFFLSFAICLTALLDLMSAQWLCKCNHCFWTDPTRKDFNLSLKKKIILLSKEINTNWAVALVWNRGTSKFNFDILFEFSIDFLLL